MPGRYGRDTPSRCYETPKPAATEPPKSPLRDPKAAATGETPQSRRYGTKAAATEPESRRYGTRKPPLRNQSRRFVDHGLGTCDLFRSEVLFL